MSDLISRKAAIDALRVAYWDDNIQSAKDNPCIVDAMTDWAIRQVKAFPSAEPELKKGRKFLGIIVNYPKFCAYPEYKGKPYYSIKYEENGDIIVGFGTYKPEVLSQFLREYFISPTESECKTGRWVLWNGPWSEYVKCTACGEMYGQDDLYIGGNDYPKFCPNCGADMRGEHE